MELYIILTYLIAINLLAFVIYGNDKRKARKNKWRPPESTLLMLAFIGGAYGAGGGMTLFRHKTKHWKFRINHNKIYSHQCFLGEGQLRLVSVISGNLIKEKSQPPENQRVGILKCAPDRDRTCTSLDTRS